MRSVWTTSNSTTRSGSADRRAPSSSPRITLSESMHLDGKRAAAPGIFLGRRSLLQALLAAPLWACRTRTPPGPLGLPPMSSDDLIADLERRAFDYFWETTDPATGLTLDRWPTPSFCSIAAVGFALTGYVVGVERGFITREQARARVLSTILFFHDAPQGPAATAVSGYKGFYYHFLDAKTGTRFRTCELSS